MATDQSLRKLMNAAGYDNSKIGYNQDTGYVTYSGQNYYKPSMIVNGTSFIDPNEFKQTDSSFRSQNPGYFQPPTTVQQPTQPAMPDYRQIISDLYSKMNNPEPYNKYQDPTYVAAFANAQQLGNQQTRQAQEAYGASGFGRSTNLGERVQRNQADINNQLMTQVVPSIVQQHNTQKQQELANTMSMIEMLMGKEQQDWQNRFSYGQAIGQFGNGQKTTGQKELEYRQARDQIADERYKQEFDEDVRRFGLNYALQKAQLNNQIANSNADNARLAAQAKDQAFLDAWKGNNVAPSDYTFMDGTKIIKGTPYGGTQTSGNEPPKSSTSYKTDPGYADDYARVLSNPEGALRDLQANSAEFIRDYGVDGFNALVKLAKDAIDELKLQQQ